MTAKAPRLTWPRPDHADRGGAFWFVAHTGRLRAPWRLSVFVASFVAAWMLTNAFVYPLATLATSWLASPVAMYSWLMLLAVLAAHVVALRRVDERPWSDVAFDRSAWDASRLVRGTLLGAGAITAVLLLLLATRGLQIVSLDDGSGVRDWSGIGLRALWVLAPAALWEELVFRGYLWRVAEDAGGRRIALVSTSIAFGAVHLLNPGANVQSLGIVVLAGVCLGLVRAVTDSVPAAWLAHLAWNWIMAAVAHVPVSGLPFELVGWRLDAQSPAWWSGGAWGPEGGLAAMLVLVAVLMWYWRARVRRPALDSVNIRSQPSAVATSGS